MSSRDAADYERGKALAERWIARGGDLNADAPGHLNEAAWCGYIDRLREEREKGNANADAAT